MYVGAVGGTAASVSLLKGVLSGGCVKIQMLCVPGKTGEFWADYHV